MIVVITVIKIKGTHSKRDKREPQLVLWREMNQRTSPVSLTIPCPPWQPCHALLGPMSFDRKSGEGQQHDNVGRHLLEHVVAAISSISSKDPPSYPYPVPPLTPSTAHGSRRRSLELDECLHSEGPRKEIYLPWQRHQQLSSGCPVPLPHTPSPAPAAAHVVSTSHRPRMMCAPRPTPWGSSLSFREFSLPNAEVSEWLLSLSTEQSLRCLRGDSWHIWTSDGRWES